MRLSVYPKPNGELWISEGNLAKVLKESKADLHLYGSFPSHIMDNLDMKGQFKKYQAIESAFKRLISHNGLRLKYALVREMKWLGISLLYAWLPFRHWLEPRIQPGYWALPVIATAMCVLALAEIALCLYEHRSLPKRFERFKINTIRHFSARPRPPVSRVPIPEESANSVPNPKFWAAFLIVCLIISSIVPVSSAWVIVHPMGGQDYVKAGPTLIRPFSSWYTVPKTHSTIIWVPLRLVENDTKIVMLEVEVEWTITKPLKFKPREWRRILDSAIGFYIHNISESIRNAASIEIKDEMAIQEIIVFQISTNLDIIKEVIESPELGSPEPMKVTNIRIRTVTMSQYSQYYRLMRAK